MKNMKQAELKKIVSKADVTPIPERKGWSNVDLEESLNKFVAVKSTDAADARQLALEAIISEPVTVRGFTLDTDKKAEE